MSRLATQHTPPPPSPELWIERLKANKERVLIILAPLFGCFSHWLGKGSGPCLEGEGECPHCAGGNARKWRGYLHAWDNASNKELFLEVTSTVVDKMAECSGVTSKEWRGTRFKFQRGNGDQTRMKVTYLGQYKLDERFPDGRTPERELNILWRVK